MNADLNAIRRIVSAAYDRGSNPLPFLRETFPEYRWAFAQSLGGENRWQSAGYNPDGLTRYVSPKGETWTLLVTVNDDDIAAACSGVLYIVRDVEEIRAAWKAAISAQRDRKGSEENLTREYRAACAVGIQHE